MNAPKIEFPCENYVIKVVSFDVDDIHMDLLECLKVHAPEIDSKATSINYSSKGRFVSFSFRIVATGEDQLSAIHSDLIAIDSVKMVI